MKKIDELVNKLNSIEKEMDLLNNDSLSADLITKIIKNEIRSVLLNQYELESMMLGRNQLDDPLRLENFGFKVYSQNDEDGIIEEIFNRIEMKNKVFVEFGIQTGLESNCHYLLHKGYKGLWIEGGEADYKKCCRNFEKPISDGRLKVVNAFITKDNINELIKRNIESITDDNKVDILSIDIDGNDYYVWDAIKCIDPRVVVIEYNAKFPANFKWVMEYDEKHIWQGDDNFGASLKAYELLGDRLGYQLVGTNRTGSNAFFVKKELAGNKFSLPATSENLYNPPRYFLKYKSGHPSKRYIGG